MRAVGTTGIGGRLKDQRGRRAAHPLIEVLLAGSLVVLAGCGEQSPDPTASGDPPGVSFTSSTSVTDPLPPKTASVRVDGRDLGPWQVASHNRPCIITADEISFGARLLAVKGTLIADLQRGGDVWTGRIDVLVAQPGWEAGPITYFPGSEGEGSPDQATVAVQGKSMSLSAPMMKRSDADEGDPQFIGVGDGTVSATCP